MKVTTSLYTLLSLTLLVSGCGKKSTETQPVRKDITETVFASGTLEPDNKYNLTAQTDGYLSQLTIEEGETITAGTVIAVVDNPQNAISAIGAKELLSVAEYNASENAPSFKQIEANIRAAEEKVKQDKIQADRFKELYESNSATKLEYENTQLALSNSTASLEALRQLYQVQKKQTEQQLIAQKTQSKVSSVLSNYNQIRAIVSGKVYKKFKEKGDYVKKGDIIATIGNPDMIYAKLSIDESNISKVQVGQEVAIQLNTHKDRIFKGTVYEILPAFDEATQSFFCKVHFTDPLDFKISGTQLQANIIFGTKKNALLIPRNYLGYGNKVFLKDKKEPVSVKTGFISEEWVEITGGLKENDVITTELIQ